MTYRAAQPAFTLIETILVLVLLSVVLMMAAPSLSNWGRGAKVRSVCDEFIAATQFARTQAITDARVYEVELSADGSSYRVWTRRGGERQPAPGEWSQERALPRGFRIQRTGGLGDAIRFEPSGRITPASVAVTDDRGRATTLACLAAGERFARVGGALP
jgi:prepilin-type N-terminal cleavage/methylation domain-containing protein